MPHHGTLLRMSADGSETDILATGFRAANGVCLNPDGTFFVTDQEGHWNPKNRINWVKRGRVLRQHVRLPRRDRPVRRGDGAAAVLDHQRLRPLAGRAALGHRKDAWGPLGGSLLNLSYGYGKMFVVPHEDVDGQKQGGMCSLPIAALPTGVMRGRFHPHDGQLYACGMFAWAGNATQPGGLYRIRYTGRAMHCPSACRRGEELGNHLHRPARSGSRDEARKLFAENLVAETDRRIRLEALSTKSRSPSNLRQLATTAKP